MTNAAAKNLFIWGSVFFFIVFLGLTYDTMKQHDKRTPPITDEVDAGKMLWQKYDCIGCHTIFGNGSYFAPDLTKITKNKPSGYLEKFLANPKGVNPKSSMPTLGITEAEAKKLVAFMDWVSKVDTNGWPPEPVLASLARQKTGGAGLYEKHRCADCHVIGSVGGTSGPDLTHVGTSKPDRDWHVKHLKAPDSVVKGSAMPGYGHLPEADLNGLADYLVTLK